MTRFRINKEAFGLLDTNVCLLEKNGRISKRQARICLIYIYIYVWNMYFSQDVVQANFGESYS